MANLNFKFYNGEDSYSDGSIENDILEIVKKGEIDQDKIIESNCYPIIYHLSYLRENILNWYPFSPNCSVLEIGAGCGAITGLLCNRLKNVISVELTKRRATINFERNKDKDNLEIFVGNLNNMKFDKKFDYIVLNGVFEYAISFTEGENPYVNFLNYVKSFLRPEGKILIAIENRFGLKYFAGAREDHTGMFFSGLNQYEDIDFVRTFTKSEFVGILEGCGLDTYKFYYPYPDYKFPNEIFTDKTINSDKFGKNYYTFDTERLNLFNEYMVGKTLANEKIAEYFSNSFLIEAGTNQITETTEIIYAKLSNDRRKEYRIATILENNCGEAVAIKKALTLEAEKHIEHLYKSGLLEYKSDIENIKGKYKKNEIIYQLLKNRTLLEEIQIHINSKSPKEILKILKKLYSYIFIDVVKTSEYSTDEFKKIFGEEYIASNLHCVRPANIDLICENIFIDNDKFIVIDTEWVFDFFIPSEFIIWRLIHDLYVNYPQLSDLIEKNELLKSFGIEDEMIPVFVNWITHFAENYVGNNKMLNKVKKLSYNVDLEEVISKYQSKNRLNSNLYYDIGDGFSEENKINSVVELRENTFEIYYDLSNIGRNIYGLRWDPIELQPCKCTLLEIYIDKGGRLVPGNAYKSVDGVDIFLNLDPAYIANGISSNVEYIKILGKFEILDINEFASFFEEKMISIEQELTVNYNEKSTNLTKQLNDEKRKHEEVIRQLKEKIEECEEQKVQLEELSIELHKKIEENKELSKKYNDICNELNEIYNSRLGRVFLRAKRNTSCLRRE